MSLYLDAEFPHISLGDVCAPSEPDVALEERRLATNSVFDTQSVDVMRAGFRLGFEEARSRALSIMEREGLAADWTGSRAMQAIAAMVVP